MAQYIDKSALVAEIERLINTSLEYGYTTMQKVLADSGKDISLGQLLHFVNTLEVKEVDLEKEIQRHYNAHKNPDNSIVKDCVIMTKDGFEYFAKHFFELGMQASNKAQKGE